MLSLFSLPSTQIPLDNYIPEQAGPGSWVPTEPKELEENEVIPKKESPFEGEKDVSNKVSMSSTAQESSIFERTEVLAGKTAYCGQAPNEGELPCSGALKNYVPLRGDSWEKEKQHIKGNSSE